MFVVAAHSRGSGNRERGAEEVAAVLVRECYCYQGSFICPKVAWVELICCSTVGPLPLGSLALMGRRVFWIEFDKEASFVTRDEAGVFCSTEHLANLRISCTVYTDDDVPGFTKIHTRS